MASPTIAATARSEETTNETNHTVNLSSSSSGDLIIVFFASDSNEIVTWPGGAGAWNVIATHPGQPTMEVAWREADGTEGATITVTTGTSETSTHFTRTYAGHEDPDTQPPEASSVSSGSNTTPDPNSITPTGGSKDYLFEAFVSNDGSNSFSAYPTNYSLSQDTEVSVSSSAAIAARALTASSEDPGTFTKSGTQPWNAVTIAIHPAAVGGATGKSNPLYGPLGGPLAGPLG